MPNINLEENIKVAMGTLMFQNIQFQTMINQLSERIVSLEEAEKAAKGPKLAVNNVKEWPSPVQPEPPFAPV